MKLNERLKMLRSSRKITQHDAAAQLGISISTYQKYERNIGFIIPSLDVMIRIADFYGVTIDYLLGREPQTDNVSSEMKRLIDKLISLPIEKQKELLATLSSLFDDK